MEIIYTYIMCKTSYKIVEHYIAKEKYLYIYIYRTLYIILDPCKMKAITYVYILYVEHYSETI